MMQRRRVRTWLDDPVVQMFGLAALGAVGTAYVVREQTKRVREEQAKAYVRHALTEVAALLRIPVPELVFDRCDNAHALQRRREICFSLSWAMDQLAASCTDASCTWNRILGVVAHEIGHILDPHLRQRSHLWHDEYEADRFAGWILGHMGVHPQDWLDELVTWHAADTHPPGHWRADQVMLGYQSAASDRFVFFMS